MLLMVDNYDSFTYNLVQYFSELKTQVEVIRNDDTDITGLEKYNFKQLVISPGPCTPKEAGISVEAILHYAGKTPVLGVCLGHQSIAEAFGGKIVRAKKVMHGKTSPIYHNKQGIFKDLPSPFIATRYHSLVIEQDSLPDCLKITAWTQTETGEFDEIMGIRHKKMAIEGVQFHPESILTEYGHKMLENFLLQT